MVPQSTSANTDSLKIFISSTITDLGPEREAIKEAIQELQLGPVFAEGFGARPGAPREECLKAVRESDIYIGLFWQRYGYITDRGVSATEEEYQEARDTGKPILIYIKEPAQRELLLTRFLRDLQDYGTGHLRSTFSALGELKEQVKRDVMRLVSQMARQKPDSPSEKQPSSDGIQVTVTGSPGAQVVTAGRDVVQNLRLRPDQAALRTQPATLSEAERQSVLRQIETYRRNLAHVEEQIARFGMTPPLHLLNERDYARGQIAELKQQLVATDK